MKKFLSVVLASIVLILPTFSANCKAYEQQVVLYGTAPYAYSSGQQVPPCRNAPSTSSQSSCVGIFLILLSITVGGALLSTLLLKSLSPDGQFGAAVARNFNSIGNFFVGLKSALWNVCVEKDSNEKCTKYFSSSVNDFTTKVTDYGNDVWGALVNNVNSFVNFNATQAAQTTK